jgi:hypothetical protein
VRQKLKQLRKNNFLEIQARWYDKLKESGFIDIENTVHELRPLKSWHSLRWQRKDIQFITAQQKYYTDAVHFLSSYTFADEEQKMIWLLHSEGMSVREIEAELSISRSHAHKIICELREIMRDNDESEY